MILRCLWIMSRSAASSHVVVGPLPFGIHPQVLLYVLLDGDPAVVDIDGRTEDIDFLEDSAVLLQNHADQRHGFAGLAGAEEDTCTWYQGHHGVRGLFAAILSRRKQLDLPHLLCLTSKSGMQLKYMGSKSWLAPHVDRLLGDVAVLHSPFFGSGKLEYYLAIRRPALEVHGVDAFEPVANLHRCYLRQDPVFLRSLLRLAGRKVDRRFYFSHLLPGTQRGRAGRRAACSFVLLRNSFSGKWGSFIQQRPLGLSSVRRMQRRPCDARTHWPIYALCPAKRRGIVSTPTLPTSSQAGA